MERMSTHVNGKAVLATGRTSKYGHLMGQIILFTLGKFLWAYGLILHQLVLICHAIIMLPGFTLLPFWVE